ncbi:MAG TPA: HTTM domain-containing protein [Lacisediminihabitans sp.]|uniref:HTTM domain-containing protein n=1 Tax=Lacisediminihabitans sp. TaxID=2787631 RepID=UPI002EDAA519
MTALISTAWRWVVDRVRDGEHWLIDSQHARYGASVARIVYGLVVVLFVIANFARRQYLWGAASGWDRPIQPFSVWGFPFTFYSASDPAWLFTVKFLLLGVVGIALLVGWHTRIAAILTLYLYISLVSTNPVATDQTDNALRIILFYFVFADMSAHWSLDARRRRRRAAKGLRPLRVVPEWFSNILHNGAIIAVALQIFIIYVVAGLSKVKGSQWQDGTAVYYPLHLQSLTPWPWLSDLASSNSILVNVVTYFAVFIQLFFPFLLLARWTRVIALVGIVGMHVGIGILMGLPLFSMAMMAADGIFIRDATYARIERYVGTRAIPWLRRAWGRRRPTRPPERGAEPVDAGHEPANAAT